MMRERKTKSGYHGDAAVAVLIELVIETLFLLWLVRVIYAQFENAIASLPF